MSTDATHVPARPSISVMFPAYNDGGTIASMVVTAVTTARALTDDFEVIVVNDGSSDYTAEVLDELARAYAPYVRVIHHPKNRGYGGALRSGFMAAEKDWIFYTDGDAQYDPHELALLVPAMSEGVDMVNGYKIERNDPLHRILIGHLYQRGVKLMFGLRLRDVDCDFRLMRRRIFDTIRLDANTGVICVELMSKVQYAGFGLAEVPVHHYHRAYGKSQFFNWRRIGRTLVALAGLWWHIRLPILMGRRSGAQRKIGPVQVDPLER
jgi:glycosyltransferase involved in cell wall biosynthesis